MRFPVSDCNHWHKNETRVYGCLLGEHPFDEEMILYKNKNKTPRPLTVFWRRFETMLKSINRTILMHILVVNYEEITTLYMFRECILVLVLVLIKDDFFIKRMFTQKASVYPGFILMSVFTS